MRIIATVILKILLFGLSLIPLFLIKLIFDEVLPNFNLISLVSISGLVFVIVVLSSAIEYFTAQIQISIYITGEYKLRQKFIDSIFNKNIQILDRISSGDIIYRGSSDTSRITSASLGILIDLPVNIIYFIISTIILIKINYIIFFVSISLIAIKLLFTASVSNKFHKLNYEKREKEAGLLDALKQTIDRLLFIKLNRLKDFEIKKYMSTLNTYFFHSKKLSIFQALVGSITGIVSTFSQLIIIILGAFFISQGEITIGLFISFMNLLQRINPQIEYFNSIFFTYKDICTSFQRIFPIISGFQNNMIEIENSSYSKNLLEVENVCVSLEQKVIFENLSFSMNRNEIVSVIGRSGCGKSTFCKLIAGIYDYQGTIKIYPDNSSNQPLMGFVLEVSSLFNGTLRENLTYGWTGVPVTNEKIVEILELVEMKTFLLQLQDGLDTNIIVSRLSHGEKQRIELARIMLIQPQLIILDEATSGLDTETERIVWSNFRKYCASSAILYITHNPNIIFDSDRLVDMQTLQENRKLETSEGEPFTAIG